MEDAVHTVIDTTAIEFTAGGLKNLVNEDSELTYDKFKASYKDELETTLSKDDI